MAPTPELSMSRSPPRSTTMRLWPLSMSLSRLGRSSATDIASSSPSILTVATSPMMLVEWFIELSVGSGHTLCQPEYVRWPRRVLDAIHKTFDDEDAHPRLLHGAEV